jgi:hypothetical protein
MAYTVMNQHIISIGNEATYVCTAAFNFHTEENLRSRPLAEQSTNRAQTATTYQILEGKTTNKQQQGC